MLHFKVPENYQNHHQWEDKLKEWCASYKLDKLNDIAEPTLTDGKRIAVGESEIDVMLKDFKAFMDDWYDCRCDKWMD